MTILRSIVVPFMLLLPAVDLTRDVIETMQQEADGKNSQGAVTCS
jgi:hypothetical protein